VNRDILPRRGALYLAFGYEYFIMAAHSAATLKTSNPELGTALITNISLPLPEHNGRPLFDQIQVVSDDSSRNRWYKVRLLELTPFEETVFLDCDTEVRGSLAPVFGLLGRYEFALKLKPRPPAKDYMVAPGLRGSEFSEWNSGVIFFIHTAATRALLAAWAQVFADEAKAQDQPALAQAIYATPELRLLSLNVIWNTVPSELRLLSGGIGQAVVWHYRYPYNYPPAAQAMLNLHSSLETLLVSAAGGPATALEPALEHAREPAVDPALASEMHEFGRRYRLLGGRLYGNPLGRTLLHNADRVVRRLSCGTRSLLRRSMKRSGPSYEKVERETTRKRGIE
jgi:hypothetical protein